MANVTNKTLPEGVMIENCWYVGTKEALLAAGIIDKKTPLPRGSTGCCESTEGGYKITRKRDGRFCVLLWTKEAADKRGVEYLPRIPIIDAPDPEAVNLAGTNVQVEPRAWGLIYTGTRDELIRARLAVDIMFPEAPKRIRDAECSDGSPIESWRITKIRGGMFELCVRLHLPAGSLDPRPIIDVPDLAAAGRNSRSNVIWLSDYR